MESPTTRRKLPPTTLIGSLPDWALATIQCDVPPIALFLLPMSSVLVATKGEGQAIRDGATETRSAISPTIGLYFKSNLVE
jgi:hypothetical protein